jgi:hypothetical protein
MVEQIKEYQSKLHNLVQRMLPERLPWPAYFYHPVERRDIGRPRSWSQFLQSRNGL